MPDKILQEICPLIWVNVPLQMYYKIFYIIGHSPKSADTNLRGFYQAFYVISVVLRVFLLEDT